MTDLLFLQDAYCKECEAVVEEVYDKEVVLNKTIFYYTSGGQPHDTGIIIKEGKEYKVIAVQKREGKVMHQLDQPGLVKGDKVICKIDWERRYQLMRYHTALHVLSAVFHKEAGVEITGNQLDVDKSRVDLSFEKYDPIVVQRLVEKTNEILAEDVPVKVYSISTEEAVQDPSLVKLANKDFLSKLKEVRIVEIVGIDRQADGGTHVHILNEVGTIEIVKTENKGQGRKRVYFVLKEKS